ncbi:Hypp347 [Branchiostoma lanceolatum]|uniref:Hypp347 protein n=1 Tax=Branchiostoma lanceolatum TaxID=7740 RepID=A0A8J9V9A9_BRALA|nr:Hypp347 [Branchiostoma lanceolatum]
MFNKLERLLLLLLLVLKDGGTATPCDNCLSSCYCRNKDLRRVPQDLPTTAARLDLMENDIGETLVLMCDVSGIPPPDVTVTLPSGLNATVESGGRVTVETNGTYSIGRYFLHKCSTYCEDLGWEQSNQLSDAQLLSTSGSFGKSIIGTLQC